MAEHQTKLTPQADETSTNIAETECVPEIELIDFNENFMGGLRGFISDLGRNIPWDKFSRIPIVDTEKTLVKDIFTLSFLRSKNECAFLESLYLNQSRPKNLKLNNGGFSEILFRFLCMNEWVSEDDLEKILGRNSLNTYIDCGLFVKRKNQLLFPLCMAPYRDSFYLSESQHVIRNKDLYGFPPAHISIQSHFYIEYLKNFLRGKNIKRMLEVGSGIGIISLELSDIVPDRTGVEINTRDVMFANANRSLRQDLNSRFRQSDLFSNVDGQYDLITFNPWQPSEDYLDLVVDYLNQAVDYLAERGIISLWISSSYINKEDKVLKTIESVLVKHSLVATRDIAYSFYTALPSGQYVVSATGVLNITRAEQNRIDKNGSVIRIKLNVPWLGYVTRLAFRSLRSLGSS